MTNNIMPFHQSGVKGGVIKVQRNDGEWVWFRVNENATAGGRVELEVEYLEGDGPTVINYATWHEVFDADTATLEKLGEGRCTLEDLGGEKVWWCTEWRTAYPTPHPACEENATGFHDHCGWRLLVPDNEGR